MKPAKVSVWATITGTIPRQMAGAGRELTDAEIMEVAERVAREALERAFAGGSDVTVKTTSNVS